MGKQNYRSKLLESGRLSGLSNQTNNGSVRGGSRGFDARLKLQLKQKNTTIPKSTLIGGSSSIADARLLLAKKRITTTTTSAPAITKSKITDARQLLLSKRKQNLFKQAVKDIATTSKLRDNKEVISDGLNTIVTLKNRQQPRHYNDDDEFYDKRSRSQSSLDRGRQAESILEVDRTRSSAAANKNAKYKPIRIKIDNTTSDVNSTNLIYENRPSSSLSYLNNHRNSSSINNESSYRMDEFYSKNGNNHNHYYDNNSMEVDYNNGNSSSSSSQRYQESSYYHSSNSNGGNSSSGHRLFISNLHPRVTEDDVLELFSDIGPIKRARFLEKGLAEVVYVKLEHAKEAIHKYDRNELDGRAMKIELITSNRPSSELAAEMRKLNASSSFSSRARSKSPQPSSSSSSFRSNSFYTSSSSQKTPTQSSSSSSNTKTFSNTPTQMLAMPRDSLSNRFKSVLANKEASMALRSHETKKSDLNIGKISLDTAIIHQVLFNKKQNTNSRPVTFTVKL